MPNRIDSLTDGDSKNLNVMTISELYVNRTGACTDGFLGCIYTAVFPNCNFGVWACSLCGSIPNIPISGIQPSSERIRINLYALLCIGSWYNGMLSKIRAIENLIPEVKPRPNTTAITAINHRQTRRDLSLSRNLFH